MYKIGNDEYPKEHLLDLENNPYYVGRLTLVKLKKDFSVDIDIVFKDGHKIFYHVETLFNFPEEREALESGIQKLSEFVRGKKKGQSPGPLN